MKLRQARKILDRHRMSPYHWEEHAGRRPQLVIAKGPAYRPEQLAKARLVAARHRTW
jgi:hypothetical protein